MEPLATLDELMPRLRWELSPVEEAHAAAKLEDASDLVRSYGLAWPSADQAPRGAKRIVMACVARYMHNPDSFTQSRAGDETVGWTDLGENSGELYLTEDEKAQLARLSGRGGITAVPISPWGPLREQDIEYVPVEYGGDDFPMFDGGGW